MLLSVLCSYHMFSLLMVLLLWYLECYFSCDIVYISLVFVKCRFVKCLQASQHQTEVQQVSRLHFIVQFLVLTDLFWTSKFNWILPSVLWHCWLGVRKSIRSVNIEWCGVGVWSKVQIVCMWSSQSYCHPKTPSSLVLPFWYWLTQVVLEKRLLHGCSSSSNRTALQWCYDWLLQYSH